MISQATLEKWYDEGQTSKAKVGLEGVTLFKIQKRTQFCANCLTEIMKEDYQTGNCRVCQNKTRSL